MYEQRRAESLRIMAETDAKRTKINELLEYIETRLQELEEEKEELKEFQDKDKERRCLEYALYQRELEEVTETLAEIEDERKAELHGANVRRERFNNREKETQVRCFAFQLCRISSSFQFRVSRKKYPRPRIYSRQRINPARMHKLS